jgi:predicted AAA+ superfamily ATPase
MEKLHQKSNLILEHISTEHVRGLYEQIEWKDRLIGILGARGTGKTTLLLQRIKLIHGFGQEAIYVSMDDLYFMEHSLVAFAEQFRQQGGKYLFIDEIHKYPNWARELKNIYDFYQDLKIVFTGSSVIDIIRQDVDLSRRALQYELGGLSFREYLIFENVAAFPKIELSDLLKNHGDIARTILKKIKPLKHFPHYLKHGYYPFFIENLNTYHLKLEQVVRLVIENDLRFIEGFDWHNTRKVHQLLTILASNVPFKPNITKLSERIGVERNTLVHYIHYLEKARLINNLSATGKSISTLQKPDKILLENPNLHFLFSQENLNKGSQREAFFLNQLVNAKFEVSLPTKGDFLVNEQWLFEVGGKSKNNAQIEGIKNAYIVADEIETGVANKLPLWLFGFLY